MQFRAFLLLSFLFPFIAFPQITNKKCKWVNSSKGTFALDTLTILPGSVTINSKADSALQISYDISSGHATLSGAAFPDSLFVCYTVLPYSLTRKVFHRDRQEYDTSRYYREESRYSFQGSPIAGKDLLTTPGLNKSGSISRGISFGNNQNVFVNSVLNLQMEGKISEDVGISASISDQNVPFQPQGNTQSLQQFDKVYIQLYGKHSKLTAGDLVMKNQPGYFLKYYRNVQGGQFEGKLFKDSLGTSFTSFGAAVSKGKFASIQVTPIEGVQGPYRLTGPNHEPYITILANSEKVYLDGRRLTRGFDYDYTIDYNQAEVTFTPNIVITKYSIIRIDFEYSDKNYGRANFNASHIQTYKKFTGYVNFFEQRDNPNNPLIFNLTGKQKYQLSLIGDTLSKAVVSGVDSVGYKQNQILYKRIDSAGMTIYEYSTNPEVAIYQVSFSLVGVGAGAYEQENSTSNGQVYTFVGNGKGSYLPVRAVPTPKMDQMVTVGGDYKINQKEKVYTEMALSNHDLNLYSKFDDQNNKGEAIKVGYVNDGKLLPFSQTVKLKSSIDYEYTDKNFKGIDRFRSINYERYWSASRNTRAFNRILNVSVGLEKNPANNITYSISRRIKGGQVNGWQQNLNGNKSFGKLHISSTAFWMVNNKGTSFSDWRRFNFNTTWKGKYIIPGITYTMNKNKITNPEQQVIGTAMYYDEMKIHLKTSDSLKTKFYANYSMRTDQDTLKGRMTPSTYANTLSSGSNFEIGHNQHVNTQITYRSLEYLKVFDSLHHNDKTFLSRIDYNANMLSRHVNSELTITTGNGRQLKKQFYYQAVPNGSGNYVWEDFNGDGKQELNEFIQKVPGMAYNQQQYIRVFLPTNQYVTAYTGSFNYRLNASAPRNWRESSSKIKMFLSRFSSVSSWSVNKKILNPGLWQRFNPAQHNVDTGNVLSSQSAMKATLFFNRTNPKFGMDLLYGINENKSLLTQGYVTQDNKKLTYTGRANIKKFFNTKLSLNYGTKAYLSDFLSGQNYLIESYKTAPQFSFQPKNNLRVTGSVSYTDKKNIFSGSAGQVVKLYQVGLETRYNTVAQRTISAKVKYIQIYADFKGTSLNSPVGYDMLQALQPGDNFTWNITWQEKLVNGLQLSFIYEGRKSPNTKIIQTGRMQASAFF